MTVVRALNAADIPIIATWLPQIPLMQRYGVSAEQIAKQLSSAHAENDLLLTADSLGVQACGLAWCIPRGMFGRSPYLRLLAVKEGMTDSGIGSALLEFLEELLAKQHSWLFLLVTASNVAAQRFYTRHGYQQIGAISGYVLPDVVECLFTKRLTQ